MREKYEIPVRGRERQPKKEREILSESEAKKGRARRIEPVRDTSNTRFRRESEGESDKERGILSERGKNRDKETETLSQRERQKKRQEQERESCRERHTRFQQNNSIVCM